MAWPRGLSPRSEPTAYRNQIKTERPKLRNAATIWFSVKVEANTPVANRNPPSKTSPR